MAKTTRKTTGPEPIEMLLEDHRKVQKMFKQFEKMKEGDEQEKAELVRTICSELTVHAQIEEEIFYPALRRAIDAPELLDEAQAEHQEAKEMIAAIEAMPGADAAMDDLVAKLAAAIEHHVKEERTQLFPKARSATGLDLDALGAELKQRQQELEAEMAA